MSKKVLKSIRDLKEGMKVFIKHNLVGGMKYGGLHWVNHMISGEMEVVSIRLVKDGDKHPLHDSILAMNFFYTNEMIDWDKTNELNSLQPKQSNFVKLPQIKTVNSTADNYSLCGTFIQIGEETISYVEGNSVGTAHCHPDDEFNLEIGKALAYYRWTKGE